MKLSFYHDGEPSSIPTFGMKRGKCVKLNNKVKTKTKEDIHARTLTNLRTFEFLKARFDLLNAVKRGECVCNLPAVSRIEFDYLTN